MARRVVLLALIWVALFAHGVSGQRAQSPQPPVFRATVDAVEFDVFVTDQRGNPVKDLNADDFVIEEDGVAQTITSFRLVDVPLALPLDPALPPGVEPDVQTNQAGEGRLYIFAIDTLGNGYELRTRRFLRRFIEQHFTANDVATLVYLGQAQARSTQDFTGNTRLLLRAADNIMGGFPSFGPTAEAFAGGSGILMPSPTAGLPSRVRSESLRALTESLGRIRGKRKVMFYFTHGLGLDVFDALDYSGGTRSIAFDELHAAIGAATRGGVAIYPIDPRGLTLDGSLGEAVDLRALADATGATAIVNTNSIESGLARIVRENSSYYVLSYSSTNDRREGRFRKVRVRVSQPGLVVRARDGYLEPLKNAAPAPTTQIGAMPAALGKAIEQPLSNPAVPMRVFAAAFRESDKEARVLIAQEIDARSLGLAPIGDGWAGDVGTSIAAVRYDAKVYGTRHQTIPVRLARSGGTVRLLSEIRVPAGRYQLRVGGGSKERAGSVMYDLEVPDFRKEPLAVSGVALTSTSARGVVTMDLSQRARRVALPGPVTAAREFGPDETVTLYAEVYENLKGAPAHDVTLNVNLRTSEGRVVRTVSQQRPAREVAGGQNGFTASVPLDGVAGGQYVVHVEARADAIDARPISRAIPIRIRRLP